MIFGCEVGFFRPENFKLFWSLVVWESQECVFMIGKKDLRADFLVVMLGFSVMRSYKLFWSLVFWDFQECVFRTAKKHLRADWMVFLFGYGGFLGMNWLQQPQSISNIFSNGYSLVWWIILLAHYIVWIDFLNQKLSLSSLVISIHCTLVWSICLNG